MQCGVGLGIEISQFWSIFGEQLSGIKSLVCTEELAKMITATAIQGEVLGNSEFGMGRDVPFPV